MLRHPLRSRERVETGRRAEKAYQDALKRIPDPKEKYDSWGMTKTPDADNKHRDSVKAGKRPDDLSR